MDFRHIPWDVIFAKVKLAATAWSVGKYRWILAPCMGCGNSALYPNPSLTERQGLKWTHIHASVWRIPGILVENISRAYANRHQSCCASSPSHEDKESPYVQVHFLQNLALYRYIDNLVQHQSALNLCELCRMAQYVGVLILKRFVRFSRGCEIESWHGRLVNWPMIQQQTLQLTGRLA